MSRRASLKATGCAALALILVVGVIVGLLAIGAVWAQVVLGIFIAALAVPSILAIIAWLVLRADAESRRAFEEHAREARARAAEEASMRRARARQSYVGPDGLPRV